MDKKKIVLAAFLVAAVILSPAVLASEAEFFATGVSPTHIRAGETATLNITLKNLGTEQAVRVSAGLDPGDLAPIDPVGPTKTQIEVAHGAAPASSFGAVNQAEEIILSFSVKVKPNASAGTYNLPLILNWSGSDGASRSQTIYLGIVVESNHFTALSITGFRPTLISPGEETTLSFTLSNEGDITLENIEVSWTSGDGSFKPLGSVETAYIELLDPKGDELISFKASADQNASSGLHSLDISLTYQDASGKKKTASYTPAVEVERAPEPELNIKMGPLSLSPGGTFAVEMDISNNGASSLHDIVVVWSSEDKAILPAGGDNRIALNGLEAGATATVPIDVIAGFTTGVYPVDIEVSYYDELDKLHKHSTTIGAQIGGGTDFQVSLQQSSGTEQSITVGNIGANTATAVVVSIPRQDGYAAVGPSEVFLGNLDPGDFSVASFNVAPRTGGSSRQPLEIDVAYTGTDGRRRDVVKTITLSAQLSSNASEGGRRPDTVQRQGLTGRSGSQAQGNNGSSYIMWGLGGLAALALFGLLWKYRGRKR